MTGIDEEDHDAGSCINAPAMSVTLTASRRQLSYLFFFRNSCEDDFTLPDIVLVEVPVPVTEALGLALGYPLSFVNGPLRSGFGNRYRYR